MADEAADFRQLWPDLVQPSPAPPPRMADPAYPAGQYPYPMPTREPTFADELRERGAMTAPIHELPANPFLPWTIQPPHAPNRYLIIQQDGWGDDILIEEYRVDPHLLPHVPGTLPDEQ